MPGRVAAVVEQCWHRVPGGTAISTVRMLAALAERGDWDVVGVAAAHRGPPSDLAAPPVPVRHLPLPRPVLYDLWHRLRRPGVQRLTGPVDVVHATGGVIPPAAGSALVVTIHDLAFLRRPEQFSARGVRFMTRAFELARAEALRVVVPSEATAAECRAHGVEGDRLRVVAWGVEPVPVTDPDRERVRARYGLPDEFVLSVGTAEPRKNVGRLVEAMSRVDPPRSLVVAGPSGWGESPASALERAPFPTHRLGQVAPADLPVLYDLASVFAYPSLQEGFGLPVLEAMAQGTAVLTSRGTATEEVAGGAARLVDPTDVDDIAAGIDVVLRDAEMRAGLGDAGRARAAEMTWEATATATAAVYEEVAG